jgi:hypothetical protein
MCLFCVYVVLCLGRGLATSWSLVQGVIPSVKMIMTWSRSQGPTGGCRVFQKKKLTKRQTVFYSVSRVRVALVASPSRKYRISQISNPPKIRRPSSKWVMNWNITETSGRDTIPTPCWLGRGTLWPFCHVGRIQAGRSRVRFSMWLLDFLNLPNPSICTMALGWTQPLTEMSTRNLPGGKGRPARKADNLTAICEPVV